MNRNIILIIATLIVLAGAAIGMFMYNMEPEKAGKQSAAHSLTSSELVQAFVEDESAAQSTYMNQVLEISGRVEEISETPAGMVAILSAGEGTINCAFEADQTTFLKEAGIESGSEIKVKGFCDGYGDLFVEVSLSRCIWINP